MHNGSIRLFLFRRKSAPIFVHLFCQRHRNHDHRSRNSHSGLPVLRSTFMSLMPKQSDLMRLTGEPLKAYLQNALQSPATGSSDFDLNNDQHNFAETELRRAAVLIAIQIRDGAPHVILTKRSSALKNHPVRLRFPGGKIDPSDATAIASRP